jgi:hypothetical protein
MTVQQPYAERSSRRFGVFKVDGVNKFFPFEALETAQKVIGKSMNELKLKNDYV